MSESSDLDDEEIDAYYDLTEFVDNTKTKVRCKICSVNIPFVERNIIEHMEGSNHREIAYKQKIEAYKTLLFFANGDKTRVKCKICYVNIPYVEKNIIQHIEGRNHEENAHKQKIEAYKTLLFFANGDKTRVKCKICYVNIPYVEKNIIEHIEGRNHKINSCTKKNVAYYKLLWFYTDNFQTKLRCKICDVNIPFMEENIIEHMEGRNHEAAENELLKFHLITRDSSKFICKCCEFCITDYLEHINSITHTLQFLEKYVIDKTEMRRYVYDDNVINAVARRHRERYRNLLKHNDISKIDDTSFYCGMCHISLSRISEIYHILGEKHRSKIEQVNKHSFQYIQQSSSSSSSYTSSSSSGY